MGVTFGGFPSRPNFASAKVGGESLRAILSAVKSGNTTRASTIALADDPDLILPLASPGRYLITAELPILMGQGVSGGFQAGLAFSGSSGQFVGNAQLWSWAALVNFSVFDALGQALAGGTGSTFNASTEKHYGRICATILTASAGNLSVQWAQQTSSALAATLRYNASLTAIRLI